MLEPLSSTLRWLSRFLPDSSPLRYRLAKLSLEDRGYAAVFDTMPGDPVLPSLLDPELGRYVPAAGAELWRRWARTCGRDLTARQQQLDYDLYLPDDVLVKMDRASMAHSIEVRSPLLDYRVVEWAARRPRAALLDGRRGKLPLRRLARTRLPAEVAEGRKRGFGISPDVWFREKAGVSMLQERLLSEEQRKHRLWDRTGVERLIDLHRSGGGRGFGTLLWRLLILSAWAHQYLDGRRFLEGPPRGSSESQGEPRRIRSGAAS
jgi:asparagine synthase (glutamine-hydrolysing)